MAIHQLSGARTDPAYLWTNRLRASSVPNRSDLEQVLSDKARIVASTAFRRLQTKAQVFSLEKNAAVRSRLTHTLEVAMYGQLIAGIACERLVKENRLPSEAASQFILCVENACLLHDIGNPPFGHLGEFAIREWFRQQRSDFERIWRQFEVPEDERRRFQDAYEEFDGNPQGFRIVTRLLWLHDEYGLNLTCALLAAMVKYPTATVDGKSRFSKKIGYFPTESEVVAKVWENLKLREKSRHPLAFLMEAADDIAYCLSDIEDAIEKRVVTQHEFFASLSSEVKSRFDRPTTAAVESSSNARFIDFRVLLTRFLVSEAAKAFVDNYETILDGSIDESLLDRVQDCKKPLDELKAFAQKRIFVSREAVTIELGGFRIVMDLLKSFLPLLTLARGEFQSALPQSSDPPKYGKLALERRLASLLPGRHLLAYQHCTAKNEKLESLYRTQVVIDYVSGMTDTHAVQVHRMLNGLGDGVVP